MSDFKMSDFKMSDIQPGIKPSDAIPTPICPLCSAAMVLAPMHRAVEAVVNVFRCTECGVQYPVAKKNGDGV
jgi:Zn ribbon nucleic-acid-binding protein